MAQKIQKILASNPSAFADYFIEQVVEAGLVLTGTEVKSLRQQSPNLKEGFVIVETTKKGFEAYLQNVHIGIYQYGNIWNHHPHRKRKLLLHKKQLNELHQALMKKGATIVPLKIYFSKGLAKVELGIGKGKKHYDKREDLKKKAAIREMKQERT